MEKNKNNLLYLVVPSLILILLIVFVYQNTDPVDVRFLWMTGKTRVIYLVIICLALGFIASRSLSYYKKIKSHKKNKNVDVRIDKEKIEKQDKKEVFSGQEEKGSKENQANQEV